MASVTNLVQEMRTFALSRISGCHGKPRKNHVHTISTQISGSRENLASKIRTTYSMFNHWRPKDTYAQYMIYMYAYRHGNAYFEVLHVMR